MKKRFEIQYYTGEQWDDELGNHDIPDNTIVFVETKKAVCMDVTADAKRIVPLLRALDKAVASSKYAELFDGWFDEWADTVHDKDFIWNYSGSDDLKRGCWSYSWGIEAIDDERVYIYLNIARPEYFEEQYKAMMESEQTETEQNENEEAETMNANQTETRTAAEMIREELNISTRSAWLRGVAQYAAELLDELDEAERYGYFDHEDFAAPRILRKVLLNGASNWNQYSEGGCSLIYDGDIAARLCTKSEMKLTRNGQREPNARESWIDVQARALHQAAECIVLTAASIAARMQSEEV